MKKFIVIYVLLTLVVLYFVEQVWMTPYIVKTLIKAPLFTLIPFMYLKVIKSPKLSLKIDKKHIPLLMGLLVGLVFLMASSFAFIIPNFVDGASIRADVTKRMDVSGTLIILAALYTIFINSFIEEYFFRGFIFSEFKMSGKKTWGYILSSFFFAVYHVTIVGAWFGLPLMTLVLVGLFVGGLIFAYVADRVDSISGSWIIHIAADVVVFAYGLIILGVS